MRVWAIVVAGGSGARFGGHKQFALLAGRPVVDWAVQAARSACDGVVLVVPEGTAPNPAADLTVPGGATRSSSVRAGLDAVPDDVDVIVVHDAARPLAGAGLFTATIAALSDDVDGAVCAVPVTDTIRQVDGGTVDRASLVAVQTPQAFRAKSLREAHGRGGEATDDATLIDAAGGTVVLVEGDRWNVKITDRNDLVVAEALVRS